jgi:hypothetical protein
MIPSEENEISKAIDRAEDVCDPLERLIEQAAVSIVVSQLVEGWER